MNTPADYTIADAKLIRSAIQRVATGPELSKNLSRDEARSVMHALLDGSADPVQAGVFLIGLRMKRETDEEFKGVMDALNDKTEICHSTANEIITISDPYNGFNRTLQGSLFTMPVLAACGMNVYSHGVELGGPKFGVTHHTIIKALGGNPLRSTDEVASRVSDPNIGWGYLDQKVMNPALHSLNELRMRIVKRPVLSTTEVLVSPIKGANKTHLVTGYVHKPYRDTYCMLARHMEYDSLLLVRGTEGGIIPSFRADAHIVRYNQTVDYEELDIDLTPLELLRSYRAEDVPDDLPLATEESNPIGMKWDINELSALCAEKGRDALKGKTGALLDAAILGAALIMWHTGYQPNMKTATDHARQVIASGEALSRLDAGL